MTEDQKRGAAWAAAEQVHDGMVVGLGGGTTAALAVRRIGELLGSGQLRPVRGVPCSQAVARLARECGIALASLAECPVVDLTIDGADEVDPALNLIKGAGGAALREKIVAQASRRLVIVVDESKLSPILGTRAAVPVDVVPFGWSAQAAFIEGLGGSPSLRRTEEGIAFRTDDGHYVLDCHFGPISDPHALAQALEHRAGVVGHGLFLGLADEVIVGGPQGVRHLRAGNPA
jgi:ribose 5-phosphate isomerase A